MEGHAFYSLVLVGILSPILGWLAHLIIEWAKDYRCHKRLVTEPLVFPGSTYARLFNEAGAHLMGPGQLAKLEKGRIVCIDEAGTMRMTFTEREFEAFHPQWTSTPEMISAGQESGVF